MHELKVAGVTLDWALGFTDGELPPTLDSNGEFELPTGRSWIVFEGFMNSYPFSFQLNSVVTSSVGIQISGEPEVIPAVDRKSTRLNSSHVAISYAVFCLKKKKKRIRR